MIFKKIGIVCLILGGVIVPWLLVPPTFVHADGGAPNLAYVAGTVKGVSVIDIGQQRVTDTLSISGNPSMILLSVDGRLLYVTQPKLDRVSVIAAKTKQVLCSSSGLKHPTLLALDSGSNTLYFAATSSQQVIGLDAITCNVKRTLQAHAAVSGLAIALVGGGAIGSNENQLWIAHAKGIDVFRSDGKLLGSVSLPSHPQYLCIPVGTSAYVTTQQGTVEAIDLLTFHASPPLLANGVFGPMDYDAVTGEIYVPDLKQHRVDVLSPVNVDTASLPREPVRSFSFAVAPRSVAITSDGQFGFIALEDGNVALLDIPGHQIATHIHVGGSPQFIITGLYPSALNLTPQQFSLFQLLMKSLDYIAAAIIVIATAIILLVRRLRARNVTIPTKE